jgi:hypothetical protein
MITLRLVAALAVLSAGTTAPALAQPPEQGPAVLRTRPLEVSKKDDPLTRCLKQRFNAALEAFAFHQSNVQRGVALGHHPLSYKLLDGMIDSAVELKDFPEREAFLGRCLAALPDIGAVAEAEFALGKINKGDVALDRYERLTVELRLIKALQGKGKAK